MNGIIKNFEERNEEIYLGYIHLLHESPKHDREGYKNEKDDI